MKDTSKGKFTRDPLAEIKEDPHFSIYSEEESTKIRLAVEIYNARKSIGMSQTELAKGVLTTQRVISNIENADVNIGINLLGRIMRFLRLDQGAIARIFDLPVLLDFSIAGEGSHNQDSSNELSEQVRYVESTSAMNLIN